jgi:excisionase family DNA binding protein
MSNGIINRLRLINRPLSAPDLAEMLGVHKVTIYKLARRGDIPSYRIASAVRFDPASVAAWLAGTHKQGGAQ